MRDHCFFRAFGTPHLSKMTCPFCFDNVNRFVVYRNSSDSGDVQLSFVCLCGFANFVVGVLCDKVRVCKDVRKDSEASLMAAIAKDPAFQFYKGGVLTG